MARAQEQKNAIDRNNHVRGRSLFFMLLFFQLLTVNSSAQSNPSPKDIKQIFPAGKLAADYKFHFPQQFEEITMPATDGIKLNALLFKADSSKGIILYLHGNADALDQWGKIAGTYINLHYDLFMPDYRGYGKSEGSVKNEEQIYSDAQTAYNYLKLKYPENKIIVLGYSIGTGPAAYLAANNHPRKLILQAPYYSLADAAHHLFPTADTTGIPFHFYTYQFLKTTTSPVVIFHGDADKVIYYGSSQKLKLFFKPGDELITLKGAGHLDMNTNKDYLDGLKRVLR